MDEVLFERWGTLQADWLREYGRDLNRDVFDNGMEWQEFCVLWTGLGPNSLWRALDEGAEKIITDDQEGELAFERIFG